MSAPVNVLIVGVGGQGVILVSKVLAALAQARGLAVKQSEVHGMAKRGGSVFSHVRFGDQVYSPTIPRGEADVLVALEWAEGLRWLPFLRPGAGIFKDQASDSLLRQVFFDGAIRNWRIVIPDFGTIAGPFQISSLDWRGEHAGEVTFDIALESAGALTFATL